MKLRTKSSSFQMVVYAVWFCAGLWLISKVVKQNGVDVVEERGWGMMIFITVLLVAAAYFVRYVLQFLFGVNFFEWSEKICATEIQWLKDYRPSSVGISQSWFDCNYQVELNLVLGSDDFCFLDDDDRCSDANYFCLFEGYFPFNKDKLMLYLTRAAIRQIHRFINHADRTNSLLPYDYVQLKFEFEVRYFGREVPNLEEYFILSRWDIQELERILQKTPSGVCSFTTSYETLLVTTEILDKYRKQLEQTELDTFQSATLSSVDNTTDAEDSMGAEEMEEFPETGEVEVLEGADEESSN